MYQLSDCVAFKLGTLCFGSWGMVHDNEADCKAAHYVTDMYACSPTEHTGIASNVAVVL